MKNITLLFSKTLVFILGLIVSFVFVNSGILYLLSNFLLLYFDGKLRTAANLGNLREGLSSIFIVAIHISKSYAGDFIVIILCSAASIIGVLLLCIMEFGGAPRGTIYVSLIPIALGYAGISALFDFLKYQLGPRLGVFWWINAASIVFFMSVFCPSLMNYGTVLWADNWAGIWAENLMYGGLIMEATYLWFYCGCFCYNFEKPSESPLFKIYRVFRAAWSKSKLRCSASEDYYWKNITEKDLYLHYQRASQIGLKPHVPLIWRCLDKAAIIKDKSS